MSKLWTSLTLIPMLVASGIVFLPLPLDAKQRFVALPEIENNRVAPRIIYVENPRFPGVSEQELRQITSAAANFVKAHFGIMVDIPQRIPVRNIDVIFNDLAAAEPPWFNRKMGDFRNGKVNWDIVRKNLVQQIEKQPDSLLKQIDFARAYLIKPPKHENIASFADAVTETFKDRLTYWTDAKLADGYPVIGRVPGRPDLPLNEYLYWTLMAKRGIEAEIIFTNQLIASVEYIPTPVHTSIRGGITGGSTEYNPLSKYGSSVWVSLFPYFSDDPQIVKLRNGDKYRRDEALVYAGAMLAHEMGHQFLQLGHPWANSACVMRPAEMLDFAAWVKNFDAANCKIGSSAAMKPGAVKAPIW